MKSKNNQQPTTNHQQQKSIPDCKTILILLVVLLFQNNTYGQTLLECGLNYDIGSLVSDYEIAPGTKSITFTIKGGDGGDAYLRGGTCNKRVRGGSGATVTATFEVSTR